MKFHLPFSFIPLQLHRKIVRNFFSIGEFLRPLFPYLELQLRQAEFDVSLVEYLSLCITSVLSLFAFFFLFSWGILSTLQVDYAVYIAVLAAGVVSLFVLFQQILYPKVLASRRIRDLERNLLPALRTMLIQLNAGVNLFSILAGIASEDYGELSREFQRIVRKINTGSSSTQALEDSASENPSLYYRRALWQLINGMKAGSDTGIVLKEVIDGLSKEQIIQIEQYGSQLNPLAMFYMIIAVILPALSMTMLIVLSSLLSLDGTLTKFIFMGIYAVILFFQILFLGLIKTRRPNLLGT
ncbi:type II secretion system F family protein [Candidatus Woesearchaeota archaeon]|nr:type II secretion system F family protein [Candidatus Woesearchaeota archaeon]